MPSIQKVSSAYSTYLPNREEHHLDRYDDRSEPGRQKKSKKSFKDILSEIDDRLKLSVPSRSPR